MPGVTKSQRFQLERTLGTDKLCLGTRVTQVKSAGDGSAAHGLAATPVACRVSCTAGVGSGVATW